MIRRQAPRETHKGARQRNSAAIPEGKTRTGDLLDRYGEGLLKEGRQAPAVIGADQHRRHVVTMTLQHPAHRDRLGHVAPAFSLHGEQHFHGILPA